MPLTKHTYLDILMPKNAYSYIDIFCQFGIMQVSLLLGKSNFVREYQHSRQLAF